MPSRRPSPEHQEAVSRRLAQLSAELAGVRPDLDAPTSPRSGDLVPDAWSDPFTHTRVRAPAGGWPTDPGPSDTEDPPPVPRPGRHAARRLRRGVATAVPWSVRGRVGLGPAQVALLAVLAAVGLCVTTWWVVRGDAQPVAPVPSAPAPGLATPRATPAGSPDPGAAAGGGGAGGKVTVDVAGKVRRPGIAVLEGGSRVVDALKAAGGARRGVDLTSLNLARLLVDGEQILVGRPVPDGAAPGPAPAGPAPLVNLNTAGPAELETLPDVGPVTAQAIIAWRTEHGGFTSVDELLEVDGIGDLTLETIAPHVTV